MTTRVLFLAPLVLFLLSCQRSSGPSSSNEGPALSLPKDDLTLLVGGWSVEAAVTDGKDWSEVYRLAWFEFATGGLYTFDMPGIVESGKITVNSAKNPKEIDLTADNGLAKNRVQSAIYKLDGDDLTICLSMIENKRPTEFETDTNPSRILFKCKRKTHSEKQKDVEPTPLAPSDPATERAVAFVEKIGGKVSRVDGKPGKPVVVVVLSETKVLDAELKELAPLTELTYLELEGATRLTDAGLKELAPLKKLKWLMLSNTKVTDAGLKELAALKSLTILRLDKTNVTDVGLKQVAALIGLEELSLNMTGVSDAGLKELAPLQKLKDLVLIQTDVTDAGFKELAKLKNLKKLTLDFTQVTGAGSRELAELKALHSLSLGNTKLTDEGLKEIAAITSLTDLSLNHTHVTEAGIREFREALPKCMIFK